MDRCCWLAEVVASTRLIVPPVNKRTEWKGLYTRKYWTMVANAYCGTEILLTLQGTVGFGTLFSADSPLLISEAVSRELGTKKRSVL